MTTEGAADPTGKKEVFMKKMEFKVRCVRECLLREGYVYTVRGYKMSSEWVWVDDVGKCYRKYVMEVKCKQDLERFVHKYSGFTDIDSWWKVIEGFCAGKQKWLYGVYRPTPFGVGE